MQRHGKHFSSIVILSTLLALIFGGCGNATTTGGGNSGEPTTVRLGYFPNLTHAVALVGMANSTFKKALGSNVTLDTKTFNAGPSLIEALFAGSIDIGYVGPNPAINGYVKSKGEALRIIAGASSGGASFIVRPAANIESIKDLNGKRLATPQLGGTQDIALRRYLKVNGLNTSDKGGTVQVVPTQNPDILTLFKQGQIDGAWLPEPWASRLVLEDGGKVLLDERDLWPDKQFLTTNVIVSKKFLDEHPDLVKKFLGAHIDTVQYIKQDPGGAKAILNEELKRLTTRALASALLDSALKNLDITYDPLAKTLFRSADDAFDLGFLGASKPDLSGIFDVQLLNELLKARNLPTVSTGQGAK